MAKKKEEKKEEKKTSKVKTLDEKFEKQFGEGVIVTGDYIVNAPQVIVPISPMMDTMLGGGIPFGSFVIPTGPPKSGKTSMALNMAANALSIPTEWGNPRRLHFFNIEGRLNKRDLLGIHNMKQHLDDGIVKVYTSRPGRILTAENYLEMGEAYINEEPGSIFIFDSFSQLCSKKGREKEWDEKEFRDNVPKYLSMFCKRISNVIPINKCIVVGVTHRIANTGFGFSAWAEASGTKIQYQVDVKLKAWSKDWMEAGEGSTVKIGKDIEWECLCSPLHNGPCETKCESKLRFGYGIDKPMELVDAAVDLGIITVGGSWYTLPGGEKVQGKDKARNFLSDPDNIDLLNDIDKQYREMMGLPNVGV